MAHVADHLSVSALEQQYRSCTDVTAARHVQTIWLLAKGHTIAEVAATVSFARRWVERLLARYNAEGPQALGDLRRRNGTSPSVLRPDLLEKLKARLCEPPLDGGLWTSPKVAAWMAGELGLAAVLPQRGWEALKAIGWSVQKPRPRHPAAATPEEREAFKKTTAAKLAVWQTGAIRFAVELEGRDGQMPVKDAGSGTRLTPAAPPVPDVRGRDAHPLREPPHPGNAVRHGACAPEGEALRGQGLCALP